MVVTAFKNAGVLAFQVFDKFIWPKGFMNFLHCDGSRCSRLALVELGADSQQGPHPKSIFINKYAGETVVLGSRTLACKGEGVLS